MSDEHRFSPEKKPKGNYTTPERNDAFAKVELDCELSEERVPGSLYQFECPECHSRLYAGSDYQQWIVQAQALAASINFTSFQVLGLACEPCHAVMDVTYLGNEGKP